MNARDEAALALWLENRGMTPMSQDAIDRMNSLLDQFYGCPTQNEYDRQMSCVEAEFPTCVTFISQSSSQSSAHS